MLTNNNRANIFFAATDDASYFGAYGHIFINTPNFDRIAKDWGVFSRVQMS
jgi:hypothetical protein